MTEQKPYIFEVDRGDGERLKIMYALSKDEYF